MHRYGLDWTYTDEAQVEAAMYRAGGYKVVDGIKSGEGQLFHFKRLISLLCPWFSWHKYSEMLVDAWVNNDIIGVAGPASTGKTFSVAMFCYAEFFCRPRGTSIIMSSIDLKGLKLRVWGAMVEILHKVKQRRPNAPGYLVPSEIRIYPTEPTDEEKNDPRDAIMGVACRQGDQWVGIGCFPAGTLVDTPFGQMKIESIRVGQSIYNSLGIVDVLQTHRRISDRLVKVHNSFGQEITCTPNHEFKTIKGWVAADNLTRGDSLIGLNGSQPMIVEVEELKNVKPLDVYDLGVVGHHYSVDGILVHNSYVGVKNDQIIGAFDECSLMGAGFWDSIANLRKNPRTKFVGMGNPKDHYDALGKICEPACGWESLPESVHSRTWKTRNGGIAVQISGIDTPNGIGADGVKCPGLNRFPYLITPEQIEQDKLMYGEDSWQFQMMDLGVFPKTSSSRRVITREICEKGNAFGEPLWDGVTKTQDYVGIDAAYSGVGGDRSPLIHIRTGKDINGIPIVAVVNGPLLIPVSSGLKDQDDKLIPAEQQIAQYVMDYCSARGVPASHVGYDSTGRGSLAHAFALLWARDTAAVEFGGLPPDDRLVMAHDEKTEREAYGKFVTALWFAWRNLIVQGQMRKLPMSVFEEGTMREFLIGKAGKTDVEPKEDTKKRLGRSPDLADALVVAIEVARRNGFQIGKVASKSVAESVKWLEKKAFDWRKLRQSEVLIEN